MRSDQLLLRLVGAGLFAAAVGTACAVAGLGLAGYYLAAPLTSPLVLGLLASSRRDARPDLRGD